MLCTPISEACIRVTKTMVVSRSQIIALDYGDLTLSGVGLEEIRSLHILGVTLDSKLEFKIYLREVASKAARRLGVVRRKGKLFNCPRLLKNCFNAYVLSSLEYCAFVWKSSAESHLGLLDSIVRNAERLCEGGHCCFRHRWEGSTLCVCSIRFIAE